MTTRPPAPGWFNEIAAFLGPAYWAPETTRVAAFTMGTVQEVDFLLAELELEEGMWVLDLGCGPGRHSLELARRGYRVHGIDLSPDFVRLAREAANAERLEGATFEEGDVCALDVSSRFDAVICLCQGGFGLLGGREDAALLHRFRRAVRPGGRLALTAFSSYFAVTALESDEQFDVETGVLHERSTLRNEHGSESEFDLWTTCFTPRELTLLADAASWRVDAVYAATPGAYARRPPDLDHPEHLLIATARSLDA